MVRSPLSMEINNTSTNGMIKKGPWTREEDEKLVNHIEKHGHSSWRALPKLAGLNRCGKSCRLRWTNYLRPDIKRGKFSEEEEQTILHLHSILGNKWSAIATHLQGRTDNEIKNFWNTHLKKKLINMGIDPMTHQPRTDLFSTIPQLLALATLIDQNNPFKLQTLNATLNPFKLQSTQAIELAKLQCLNFLLQPSTSTSTPSTSNTHYNNNHNPALDPTLNVTLADPNLNPTLTIDSTQIEMGLDQTSFSDFEIDGTTQLLHNYNSLDPQVPFICQTPLNGENISVGHGGLNNDIGLCKSPPWILPSSAPSYVPLPPLTDMSSSECKHGDASSTSSYGGEGGASYWPELLLEDLTCMRSTGEEF